MKPSISCMCLTFGRPHLLEEALYSFLNQKYDGKKEIIILNDLPEQTLIFDHPEVKIINVSKRFKTIGEKRNAAAALCTYDVHGVLDDDDIFLPNRLSYSVRMKGDKRYFKPTKAYFLHPNMALTGPHKNWFCCNALWDRSLFYEAGLYTAMNSGQDADLEMKFQKILGPDMNYGDIDIKDVYYLYRWRGSNFHLSNFGKDKPGEPTGEQKVKNFIDGQIRENKVVLGEVKLNPHWNLDYVQLVKDYIDRKAGYNVQGPFNRYVELSQSHNSDQHIKQL